MALRLGGSPVFMLPTGYTVNSKSANIINNWYKGFDPLAKNVAVPEPSTLSILLLALLFFTIRLFKTNIKHKA
ncbi:MAG: hypothetical protein COB35_04185 [Gammaproteobacteria bacterium]|nr:MAG: hypothetical protein COB35_04185 [Gammaproteobacteria bacterium]